MKIIFLSLLFFLQLNPTPCFAQGGGGTWSLLLSSIGISAMHMQLLPNDRVVIFDRTDFGTSNVSLPDGKCRAAPVDCSAHSVEYDVKSNSIRPLMALTDFWCSSGTLAPDGTLVQTGGDGNGTFVVRKYKSCDGCDWEEFPAALASGRWYATNHKLPDGRQIIIGGRNAFTYEFYPKTPQTGVAVDFPFLRETRDGPDENNLYPFVFLCPDGNLFIFANNRAILFDYVNNLVVKTFPSIPGDEPRNYPSTGSGVLLPMRIVHGNVQEVEVLVCGGAPRSALSNAILGKFDKALNTCGRLKISDLDPQWVMETMPLARVMGDMLLLPNGEVLMINGGSAGTAGWELGRDPVLTPVVYKPGNTFENRFELQTPTTIPRMYHSTALLLRDGRVIVGGSNPHNKYEFQADTLYPTDLSLQQFSPTYLDSSVAGLRPIIILPGSGVTTGYGNQLNISFVVSKDYDESSIVVTMVSPSFVTHSFSMNQRVLVLEGEMNANDTTHIRVVMPLSPNIAPPGYYLLYVVHENIPSEGIWIQLMA